MAVIRVTPMPADLRVSAHHQVGNQPDPMARSDIVNPDNVDAIGNRQGNHSQRRF